MYPCREIRFFQKMAPFSGGFRNQMSVAPLNVGSVSELFLSLSVRC